MNTWKNRVQSPGEENDGISDVETAGYIPAKVKIEHLMQAGIRLAEFRKEQFDFPSQEEVDWNFIDPTRVKGFDMAEASQYMNALDNLSEQQRAEILEKEASEVKESKIMPEKASENVSEEVE